LLHRNLDGLLLWINLGLGLYLALAMPVFAQESYYWCYSEHPDLSYYDHPPMVAWLIWVGTSLFGDGGMGIRFGTLLCGGTVLLSGLRLLTEFGGSPDARRTWLGLGLVVPNLLVVRFLANPDPPLCAFWMLTLLTLWKARFGGLGWWIVAGFFAGCALLSKYTAIFLAAGGVIVLLADPLMRRQLLRPGPWLGLGVAVLTFLPVLLWNFSNDFESFRFQTQGRWADAEFGAHRFGQLIGGQLLVLNPVVAVGLVASSCWLICLGRRWDYRAIWMLAFSLPMVGFLLFSSVFVQVKINWLIPAMLPLLLGLSLWWGEGRFRRRQVAASRCTRVAIAFGLLQLLAPLIVLFPQGRGSTWTGWEEITARAKLWEETLDGQDGIKGNVFFFAGNYKDTAQLMRNLRIGFAEAEPGEFVEPTLAQNVIGRPALQFDHWENPIDHVGHDAIFVLPRPDQRDDLLCAVRTRFSSLEHVERVVVKRIGMIVLTADLFVCRAYRGPDE